MARILIPVSKVIGNILPAEIAAPIDEALSFLALDLNGSRTVWDRAHAATEHRLIILQRICFDFPLLPGTKIEIGEAGHYPEFSLQLTTSPIFSVTINDLHITLRVSNDLMMPYEGPATDEPRWSRAEEISADGFPISWQSGLRVDLEGNINAFPPELEIPYAAMIGETGLILHFSSTESEPMRLILGDIPEDLVGVIPDWFHGIWIPRLLIEYFKEDSETKLPQIVAQRLAIGSGGFSGILSIDGTPALSELTELMAPEDDEDGETEEGITEEQRQRQLDELIERFEGSLYRIQVEGFQAILYYLSITFQQSLPAASSLKGFAYLPFVEKWMAFDLSLGGPTGDLMLQLGGVGDEALISLENDWLEIRADTITYFTKDGVHYAAVSGSVRPKILQDEGFDWPEFQVERLLVSSDGDIELDGQWIDVPETITLDFYGFTIDISQVGFGTEGEDAEERQWLGLSGEISLVKGLPITASVEGLKFTRNPDGSIDVTLTGIGVELEIPETLSLQGMVSYKRIELTDSERDQAHGLSGDVFMGAVKLNIIPAKFEIDGQLLIGKMKTADGQPFTAFYIMLDADTPVPIPLGGTNTALYSVAFLIGSHVAPDRKLVGGEPVSWYEWYKEDRGPVISLDKEEEEDEEEGEDETEDSDEEEEEEKSAYSVTAVQKWRPELGHIAMGFGVTIGTYFDDGFSLNVKAMLAILMPGPVIIIEGKADILKNRGSDDEENRGAFYSLAVIDGNAGTFELNIDVQIDLVDIIAIEGGLEAFFDFNDPLRFYFYLGRRTPESKRIQAKILGLFNANTYFMVDAFSLQTGAGVSLDIEEEFGPISFALIARASLEFGVWWTRPVQFEGLMGFYGEVSIKIFGIGLGLIIELLAHLKTATPWWFHGRARLALTLPWPLPDIDLVVDVTWDNRRPPRPVPFLKGARMMHPKLPSAGWELMTGPAELTGVPVEAPVVPVDAQALLAFARPIHGYSQARNQAGELVPAGPEVIDAWAFTYRLGVRRGTSGVMLQKRIGPRWVSVHALDPSDLPPTPGDPVIQPLTINKNSIITALDAQEPVLQLWGNTPVDGMPLRWREATGDVHPPCRTQVRAETHCLNWLHIANGFRYPAEFTYRDLRFVADVLTGHSASVQDGALFSPAVTIRFPDAIGWFEITVRHWQGSPIRMEAYLRGRRVAGPIESSGSAGVEYTFNWSPATGANGQVDAVRLSSVRYPTQVSVPVVSVCYKTYRDLVIETETAPEETAEEDSFDTLGSLVLEPHSEYRLEIHTVTEVTENGEARSGETQHQFYYFRTGGGPATSYGYLPAGSKVDFAGTPLDELRTYVARTIPADGARRFYYGYDLAVEFNEGYVRDMYPETEHLAIRISDRNGKTQDRTEGVELIGLLPLMPESVLTWLSTQSSGGCLARYAGSPPFSSVLSRPTPQLKGNRMYVADLVLRSTADESERETGYRFQFATSRYGDIADHLRSAENDAGLVVVRTLPSRPGSGVDLGWITDLQEKQGNLAEARRKLSETIQSVQERGAWDELPAVAEMLAEAKTALAVLDEFCTTKFNQLFADSRLALEHAPLPPALEFNRLHFKESPQVILLIESPEPLEWERIEVQSVFRRARVTERIVPPIVWSQDKTRALLFDEIGLSAPIRMIRLEFVYRGDLADLPPIYQRGEAITTSVSLRLQLDTAA